MIVVVKALMKSISSRRMYWPILVLLFSTHGAWAQNNIMYKCAGADGRIEYTNKVTVNNKSCVKLTLDPVVVPAPKLDKNPAFPKVDNATQKARDSNSKAILQEELKAKETKLAELQKEFKNGEPDRLGDEARNYQKYLDRVQKMRDDITRVESDIAALKNEIAKAQ